MTIPNNDPQFNILPNIHGHLPNSSTPSLTPPTGEELKPCPFCGGEAEKLDRFNVKCSGCGAEINALPGMAVDLWNTRKDKELAELRKEAESTRERAAKEVRGEPELPGQPPEPITAREAELMRKAVRITKRNIEARILAMPLEEEQKPLNPLDHEQSR